MTDLDDAVKQSRRKARTAKIRDIALEGLENLSKIPRIQHIDLQKERNLTNNVNWCISGAAWALTVAALITHDKGVRRAAIFTWGFGSLLASYEVQLDKLLEGQ